MQPTIVYKKGGKHIGPGKGNQTYSYKGVSTEEELAKALKAGWFESLAEAFAPPVAPKVEAPPVVEVNGVHQEEATIKSIQYKDLTEGDKENIMARLEAGEKPSDIGKDYGLHHLSVVRVKRELD